MNLSTIIAVVTTQDASSFAPFLTLLESCNALTGGPVAVVTDGPAPGVRTAGITWETMDGTDATVAVEKAAASHAIVFGVVRRASDPLVARADRTLVAGRLAMARRKGLPENVSTLHGGEARQAVDRAARELTGRRVGLVLGAGGVRGFAHPGVLQALEEGGVPIDLISAASVGAIAAALYLSGVRPADITDFRRILFDTLRLATPGIGIPTGSFWSGRRLRRYLHAKLGDAAIEDLPIPFAIATADAGSRREVVLDRGSLVDAVYASSALPGLYPPAVIGKRRLIDGGVVNPVPITEVIERGADIVIAVNVMTRHSEPVWHMPNLPVVGSALNKIPAIAASIRSAAGAVRDEMASLDLRGADVLIQPKLTRVRPWDFLPARAFHRAGYEAATEALPRIRALLGPSEQSASLAVVR